MARNSVNIKMSRRLTRNLRNLPDEIDKAVKSAMVNTALVKIETVAKQTLTQEKHVDTGRLRASIHTRYGDNIPVSSEYGARFRVGDSNKTYIYFDKGKKHQYNGTLKKNPIDRSRRFQIFVGTNVEYAGYIERRFPYLIPAFESSKQYMARKIRSILRRY